MIRALLALALASALTPPCRAGDPAAPEDAKPPTGAFALAPLIGGTPEPVEREQPTQPVPSSMDGYDQHLADDTPADIDRLARLAAALTDGGQQPASELDWARRRLALATKSDNVARARKDLIDRIRRDGLTDDFSGDQILPPNAPDSKIAPIVDMKLRAAREEARQLLELINTTH